MARKYDLIIFGASGFTGQYVIEELVRLQRGEGQRQISWAIAGRNMRRLEKSLSTVCEILDTSSIAESVPIIIADIDTPESLIEMAKQCKILLNCVGPYNFWGEKVVKACLEAGTHHLDVSGEPLFLESMQLRYHVEAEKRNVYVIGSCAFDSIPADMGLAFTKQKFPGRLHSVDAVTTLDSGGHGVRVHFGTLQSAVHSIARSASELKSIRKQLYPTPMPKPPGKPNKRQTLFWSTETSSWCVPNEGSDRSVVYRTQRFFHTAKDELPVRFQMYFGVRSLFNVFGLFVLASWIFLLSKFRIGRFFIERFPRLMTFGVFSHEVIDFWGPKYVYMYFDSPGDSKGPSRQQILDSSFQLTMIGHGESETSDGSVKNSRIVTRVSGPEAGYVATPICLLVAALTLLEEEDKLPSKGGVYTPASAFRGTSLIERLNSRGVTFNVLDR